MVPFHSVTHKKTNINPAPNNCGYELGRLFSEENSSTTSGPFWEIRCLFHALKQYLWDAVQLKEGIKTYPEENPFLIRPQERQLQQGTAGRRDCCLRTVFCGLTNFILLLSQDFLFHDFILL